MELESLTPERLSDKEQSVQRIMTQRDPRFPETPYPGSASAVADSVTARLKAGPSTAKVKTREDVELGFLEKIAGWQAKLDETKVDPATGDPVPKYGDATRRSYQKLIDNATRKLKILSPTARESPETGQESDGSQGRPYEIQESQEQYNSLSPGSWYRLPGDPPGKVRQKPL